MCVDAPRRGYTLRRQDTGAASASPARAPHSIRSSPRACPWWSARVSPTGDQFIIHPTRDALAGIRVAITDPARVAAAAPIRAAAATTNSGTATVTPGEVLDAGNATLLTHGQHRFHLGDDLLSEWRPDASLHAGWQHRLQRLARPDQRRARVGDLHRAQQRRRLGDNRNAFALVDAMRAMCEGGTVPSSAAVERLTGRPGLRRAPRR